MPSYRCPECEAVLRREEPVPPGKKIKCPKCEFVFAPKGEPAEKAKSKSKAETPAKAKPAKDASKSKGPPRPSATPAIIADDDEEGGAYTVVEEKEQQERAVHYGSLRDKFHKSKRGPAMAKCVVPSNFVLYEGFLVCIGTIVLFLHGIWPMVFSDNPVTFRERLPFILGGVFGFALGSFICYCASVFHELSSYVLAWIGVILAFTLAATGVAIPIIKFVQSADQEYLNVMFTLMAVAFAALWAYGGIRGINALRDPEVREGFAEIKADKEGALLG